MAAPPLLTLEHGRLAGEMLVSLIRGEHPERALLQLELELVVRASCGSAKGVTAPR